MLYVDAALTTSLNDDIYHNDGKCYMDPDCNIELLINSVDQPLEPGNVPASTLIHEESAASGVTGHQLQTTDATILASQSQPYASSSANNMLELWTAEETCYLVSIMHVFVGDGDEMPATLNYLEKRLTKVDIQRLVYKYCETHGIVHNFSCAGPFLTYKGAVISDLLHLVCWTSLDTSWRHTADGLFHMPARLLGTLSRPIPSSFTKCDN